MHHLRYGFLARILGAALLLSAGAGVVSCSSEPEPPAFDAEFTEVWSERLQGVWRSAAAPELGVGEFEVIFDGDTLDLVHGDELQSASWRVDALDDSRARLTLDHGREEATEVWLRFSDGALVTDWISEVPLNYVGPTPRQLRAWFSGEFRAQAGEATWTISIGDGVIRRARGEVVVQEGTWELLEQSDDGLKTRVVPASGFPVDVVWHVEADQIWEASLPERVYERLAPAEPPQNLDAGNATGEHSDAVSSDEMDTPPQETAEPAGEPAGATPSR